MSQSNHNLAALVGSRICHDLISPIGAIRNGLELLTMDGRPVSPEMALIAESVENANARVRFLRVAFGMASEGQKISGKEITGVLADIEASARVDFDWLPSGDMNRQRAQEVFLALQCFESAMPTGGTVTVREIEDGARIQIAGAADPEKPSAAAWGQLRGTGAADEILPAHVHFALLPALLAERGRQPELEIGEDGIALRI